MGWEPCACKKYKELLGKKGEIINKKLREAQALRDAGDNDGKLRKLQLVVDFKKKVLWPQAVKACAAAAGGRRRRRRRRRRTRRGGGRGTDKFGRQLGTKRKRDADIRRRRTFRPRRVREIEADREAGMQNMWAAAAAKARARSRKSRNLSGHMKRMTLKERGSIKKKGGRRRTRRRRGGMNAASITAWNEAELKRRQMLMVVRDKAEKAAEKAAADIQKILKETAQKEVAAAAKRVSKN
jgi:hypothetical protein